MDALVGFHVDEWDYITFLVLLILAVALVVFVIFILGLPGRIALARNHPEAEAVNLMGYLGFLAVVPWVNAFIWAFKPTDVIDIRYLPKARQRHTDEAIAKLSGKTHPEIPSTEADPQAREHEP
jgi:Protein of unknown function (DUF3302)